jgi:hypothetical protein
MKLDLGAGPISPEGFVPMGRAHGSEVYPLPCDDGVIDEIRASHILEHFSHREVGVVIAHWVQKLKPGGVLRVAVPDLDWIARHYLSGDDVNVQRFLMGAQTDGYDCHRCAFDEELLAELMRSCGLIDVARWQSELKDCASLPVSLNLMGTKPLVPVASTRRLMSSLS